MQIEAMKLYIKLISIPNYKKYKVTFSDLVSKCDVMQKAKRKRRKTSINWSNKALLKSYIKKGKTIK